jgi:hypothetical protein
MDGFNLDVTRDSKLEQVAGPALTRLLERGEIDAMTNISSLNLAAESQPEKFRVLFSPNDYWKQKTGYPIGWAAPIVAWRSWVDEDQTRARNFATATMETFQWLANPANLKAAVKNHGELAGVKTPAEIGEYQDWLQHKDMFLTDWDHRVVDAQWQFLKVAQRVGVLEKVPAEDRYALFVGG